MKDFSEKHQLVIVLDFGGQYNQLIARRVREANVYCEMLPYTTPVEDILAKEPKGIIFSGGPSSVYGERAPVLTVEFMKVVFLFWESVMACS